MKSDMFLYTHTQAHAHKNCDINLFYLGSSVCSMNYTFYLSMLLFSGKSIGNSSRKGFKRDDKLKP